MRIRSKVSLLAPAAGVVLAVWLGTGATDPPETVRNYHVDGPAMGRAAAQASAALLRDDLEAARQALRTLDASAGRIQPEEDELFGVGSRTYDRALHKVLSRTRESLADGKIGKAFDEFMWAQRTCRECHAAARKRGLLPADGPLWQVTPEATANSAKSAHPSGQEP